MTDKINTTLPQAYQDFERMGYKVSQYNGQSFVEIDGKTFTINPWDTVWTVTHRQQLTKENEEKKSNLWKKLEDLKEQYKLTCKNFGTAMDNKKSAQHNFITFLMNNHVPSLINLKGTAAYEEGCALRETRAEASSTANRALAEVLDKNHTIQNEIFHIRHLV